MPSYPWTCGACAAVNESGRTTCATCDCPASSTRQQRLAYLAAHDGTGPPVVAPAIEPVARPRRAPRAPGTAWFVAAALFAFAAAAAFLLLWGGGPVMIPMGGGPGPYDHSHEFWNVPDGVQLGAIATLLLAPLAALACGVVAVLRRGGMPRLAVLGWGGLALLVLALVCCR